MEKLRNECLLPIGEKISEVMDTIKVVGDFVREKSPFSVGAYLLIRVV